MTNVIARLHTTAAYEAALQLMIAEADHALVKTIQSVFPDDTIVKHLKRNVTD